MKLDRRTFLAFSGYALTAGLLPARQALAADIKSLLLIEPLGEPSFVWKAFNILRPGLQKELGCDVAERSIRGHDGFDAVTAILAPQAGETRLFGGPVFGSQFAERVVPQDIRIESLTPVVKLTNGFSVTLFTKRGGPLRTWKDLATVKPLKVTTPQRATVGNFAELMVERTAGIATEVTLRASLPEVIEDVLSGRSDAGITRTLDVIVQLDRLQPIVSFGAARNPVLNQTPTFAEVMGNPKLAFTDSLGVYASPKIEPSVAALLTKAFITLGQDPDVIDEAEAANLPLAVNGPEVLVETMKRNERVLQRILGV